jgi:DNA-binding MarR family transcriptional regulator
MSPPLPAFVEDFAVAMADIGFPRMPARVFSLMLAADDDGLTARELAERLQVSAAAISGAVGYLGRIGLVRRWRRTGERVDRHSLGTQVWEPVILAEVQAYGPLTALCESALEAGDVAGRGAERIAETRDFLAFMAVELPRMLDRWRAQRRR